MSKFTLVDYISNVNQVKVLSKKDAHVRLTFYFKNSGQKGTTNDVDDDGNEKMLTGKELKELPNVYVTNGEDEKPLRVGQYVDCHCAEYYSDNTSETRKNDILNVSQQVV